MSRIQKGETVHTDCHRVLVHRRPHNHSYHALEVFKLANNGYYLIIFNYILILVIATHMKHQNANITRNVSCVPGLPVHALGSTKAHSVHGIQPTGDAPNPQDDE